MPRLEVSPAQRHPASQQGGRGRWKPGWRSLGEVGGWRLSAILLFSHKQRESESFHFFSSNFRGLVCCGLAGLTHVPVFSRVWGDEMNKVKVKVLSPYLYLLVNFFFEYQCLIRSRGRKYSRWFNKFKFTSLLLQSKNIIQTSLLIFISGKLVKLKFLIFSYFLLIFS